MWVRAVVVGCTALALTGSAPPAGPALRLAPLSATGAEETLPPTPWRIVGLPLQTKPYTRFVLTRIDGESALRIEADRSYGNLVHPLPAGAEVRALAWRWRVDEALPAADITRRSTEDVPLRVCMGFDLPLEAVPFLERQIVRAARGRGPDALPLAAVCYVWNSRLAPGSELASPFTRRIRYVVLHGPEAALHTWFEERRDVQADLLRLFADETRSALPATAVIVGADADNTRGHSLAYLTDLRLSSGAAAGD